MNRRDFFLLLRNEGSRRVATLSCQRLYMCYHDASVQHAGGVDVTEDDEGDWWLGEPASEIPGYSREGLFTEAAIALLEADTVVVEGRDWLKGQEFSDRVQVLLDDFTARGGRVHYENENSRISG